VGLSDLLQLDLPADPEVLSGVRRLLRRWLRDRGAGEPLISEVALAANEACANAVEHAYSPGPASFELTAQALAPEDGAEPFEIIITVRDRGRWRAPGARAEVEASRSSSRQWMMSRSTPPRPGPRS
jgi:anti-sigma regulatory factor (Ser/Thr protein kinase)